MIRFPAVLTVLLVSALACGGDNNAGPTDPGGTPVPSSIAITPAADTLHAIGDTLHLGVTVHDQHGAAMGGVSVVWTSSDEDVATVDAAGRVVAAAPGTAHIHAAAGDLAGDAVVVVHQVAASIGLTVPDDTLADGDTTTIAAAVADSNGVAIPDAVVAWTTSDATAATVDASGRVTAVRGEARATITATMDGVSANTALLVLGKVVFVSDRSGNSDLYLMNTDGTGVVRLTSTPGRELYPAWSPDGSRIAFVTDRDGNGEIYVMNADGTGVTRLTNTPGGEQSPAWSPDGTRIAFVGETSGTGDLNIYVMNADGSGVTQLTTSNLDIEPDWSPDGTHIAFTSLRDRGIQLSYIMLSSGAAQTRLLADTVHWSARPLWSPDGGRVAFTSNALDPAGDVYVKSGSTLEHLVGSSAADGATSWSSDGSRILFTTDRDGNGEVYVMGADGSGQMNLTRNGASDSMAKWRPRPVR